MSWTRLPGVTPRQNRLKQGLALADWRNRLGLRRLQALAFSVDPTDEQCRRLLEASPDGILVSRAGRIHFLNPAASRILGMSQPEVCSTMLLRSNCSIPTSRALVRDEWIGPAVENGRRLDAAVVRPDGAISDVEAFFSGFAGAAGTDGPNRAPRCNRASARSRPRFARARSA